MIVVKPSVDIYGNGHTPATLEKLKCVKCSTLFPTNRYAQHLEKCLGLGGRRATTRNVKRVATSQSSPSINGSDHDDYAPREKNITKKRSSSPLPPNVKKIIKTEPDLIPIGKKSSTSTRQNTPPSNNLYSSSVETTPTVSTATITSLNSSMLHPMFSGKTKPGMPIVGGKIPVNGFGKVPRVASKVAPALIVNASGRVARDDSDFEDSDNDWGKGVFEK
ncbi:hypothetical protein HK100_012002 [Physocladia obscura]|uniref:SAGA-associated factor 11 n=1 Tax=Physocladia obscura TaxID=109957 RepID=A0AAD5XHS5_9FUNG|nr:hypothetical protein HK100_012002 [Physocladia obscura]